MRAVAGKRVAAGIAGLLLCVAPTPTAATDPFPLIGEFQLRGSKGYEINGFIIGTVAAIEARSGRVSAEYVVEGRRAKGRFEARFGSLGRLAIAFHPASRRERCEFQQRGAYRGTIRFNGERGYTEVDASAAQGNGFTIPTANCSASASRAERPPILTTHLHAIAKHREQSTSLSVFGLAGFGRHFVLASRQEQRSKMLVTRYAYTPVGGDNAFISSGPGKHPGFAFLKPPKPFAGSAVFEETGDAASTWAGDLSVWLPGAGRVSLAGPRFSSNLCRRRADEPGCALEPTVRRPLSTLQGSGSQSQLFAEARLSWSRYLRNSASSAGSTP